MPSPERIGEIPPPSEEKEKAPETPTEEKEKKDTILQSETPAVPEQPYQMNSDGTIAAEPVENIKAEEAVTPKAIAKQVENQTVENIHDAAAMADIVGKQELSEKSS